MKIVEEHAGVFLRLSIEGAEEKLRYVRAYDDACRSGVQCRQTSLELQSDGAYLVGIWLDVRLVEPLLNSIGTEPDSAMIIDGEIF